MLKISKDEKTLSRLKTPSLSDAKIKERADLQEFIWKSPKAFCEELGQDLWIIGKEVCPSDAVDDRIDLLAIDGSGRPTIIELKRGSHKLHLYQAISYAGMVAFAGADINEIRRQICAYRGVDSGRAAGIEDFLRGMEPEDLPGYEPGIILVAEAFEYEVLAGAKWLVERHGVDIACVQVSAANDETNGAEYLAFTQVFPTSEIEEIARSRKRRGSTSTHAPAPKVKPGAEKELLALADARQTRAMLEECRRLKDVWDEKPQADHFDYSRKTPEGWRDLLKVYIRPEPEKLDAQASWTSRFSPRTLPISRTGITTKSEAPLRTLNQRST